MYKTMDWNQQSVLLVFNLPWITKPIILLWLCLTIYIFISTLQQLMKQILIGHQKVNDI